MQKKSIKIWMKILFNKKLSDLTDTLSKKYQSLNKIGQPLVKYIFHPNFDTFFLHHTLYIELFNGLLLSNCSFFWRIIIIFLRSFTTWSTISISITIAVTISITTSRSFSVFSISWSGSWSSPSISIPWTRPVSSVNSNR